MGVIEIFPDLLVEETGSKTLTGAASSLLALNDVSDASYITAAGTVAQSWYGAFRMGSFAIPAGAVVSRVQMKMRYSNAVKLNDTVEIIGPLSILVGRFTGGRHAFLGYTTGERFPSFSGLTTPVQEWIGPYRASDFDGNDYLNELLQTPNARLYGSFSLRRNWPYNQARIYSGSLLVHYNEAPTVTLNTPTGTINVSRPTFTWSFSDPDGDEQVVYELAIYDSVTAALPGFTPDDQDTYKPVQFINRWGQEHSFTLKKSLPEGAYVAYLRATHIGMVGSVLWPAWSSQSFTVDVDGPATPVVDANYDAGSNGIIVNVQGKDNLVTWPLSSYEPATPYTPSWIAGASTTAARTTAQFKHGTASLSLTRTGTTGTAAVSLPAAVGNTWGIKAKPAVTYTARASFRAATTARSCRVGLAFYDSAGAQIGSTTFGSNVSDSNANFNAEATVSAAAPALTTHMRVVIEVLSAAASEVHYVDQVGVFVGTVAAWTIGGFPYGDYEIQLQRSADSGFTWYDVPDELISFDGTTLLASWGDFTASPGATISYRARVDAEDLNGDELLSAWSATDTASMPSTKTWWLRDPQGTLSIPIHVSGFRETDERPMTSDYPLGSDAAVVTHDGMKRGGIALSGFTLTKVAYDGLKALTKLDGTLLLQDNIGNQYWIQSVKVDYERLLSQPLASETTPVRNANQFNMEAVQVTKPFEFV